MESDFTAADLFLREHLCPGGVGCVLSSDSPKKRCSATFLTDSEWSVCGEVSDEADQLQVHHARAECARGQLRFFLSSFSIAASHSFFQQFLDIVLSRTQRKTPTEVHKVRLASLSDGDLWRGSESHHRQ
jgi:hypothetical protein